MNSRVRYSEYMQWAKRRSHTKYNLASSGVMNFPLAQLPVTLEDLEISGDSYYGYAPLQEALAQHCGVSSDRVFSTIGTSLANHIAMATILEQGDEVLIEHPTYELLISTARYIGAHVKRFPRRAENGFRIDPNDIRRATTPRTKLVALTNLHNPSSVLTEEDTLRQIGTIARNVGAHVLVDEVYLDAAFDIHPRSSIHLGEEFIITSSLTKVYGLSGLRCGWVLASPDLIQKMWYLNDLFEVIPAHPAERLSVIALNNLDRIRSWVKSLLFRNHQVLNQFLCSRNDLETVCPGFGTVVFPRLMPGNVDKLLSLILTKYETTIAPGRFFEMPEYFRIGLGTSPEIFEQGLMKVGYGLDELRNNLQAGSVT